VRKDPDAISARRPYKYIDQENAEIEKTERRGSVVVVEELGVKI
jgi:hypothetical protein